MKRYYRNQNTGTYSARISSSMVMILLSVIVSLVMSLICSMFDSLVNLTIFFSVVASLILLFSIGIKLFDVKKRLGSWRYVHSYFSNLTVIKHIYQAMLTNHKSQVVYLPKMWAYNIGQTLVVKMSKTADIFSTDLPHLEELISASLKGRYKDYVVVESYIDSSQNYLIFLCRNINVDQTFRPSKLDDFMTVPYKLKLQNDLVVNLSKNPHIAIWGRTGSGKTTVLYYIVAQLLSCASSVYIADGKHEFIGLKNFYPPDHIAEEPQMMLQMLDVVLKKMDQRQYVVADEVKKKGVLSLTAEDLNLKPVVLIIDEVASVLAQFTVKDKTRFLQSLIQIVQKGRSAGVFLVVASQSPATDVLPNSIRSQFGTKILLGSATDEVQRMAFGSVATSGDLSAYTGYYLIDGEIRPKKYFVPDLGEWATLVTFERLDELSCVNGKSAEGRF